MVLRVARSDFIEDRLVVPGAYEDYESYSVNDWKRLRKSLLEITEEVRRGFLLKDVHRKAINTVIKPLIFRISWWGKFSFLLKSETSPATTARHYYYVQKYWRLYDWNDDDCESEEPDPFDYPKSIKKAEHQDFYRCLEEQMRDEIDL